MKTKKGLINFSKCKYSSGNKWRWQCHFISMNQTMSPEHLLPKYGGNLVR